MHGRELSPIRIAYPEREAFVPGRVLILEDDFTVRRMLGAVFQHRGFEVCSFSTPEDYNAIRREVYNGDGSLGVNAIVSDVTMPGMTGIQFMHRLAAEQRDVPPCALLSGYWTPENLRAAQELGCATFEKPHCLEAILHWLQTCVCMA